MTGSAYPFLTKDGTLDSFKTVSTDAFSQFQYGDIITGSYPYTSSISSDYHDSTSTTRYNIRALKNTLNYYKKISPHYAYSSSLGDKFTQDLRLISIPSIFYGSSIHKGSVSCKFYLTGTLIAELNDENQNGELIQIGPSGSTGSGSVAGVVLYREGFVLLTGSWSLHPSYTDNFVPLSTGSVAPAWKHFFTTGSNGADLVPSSSFGFTFEGVQKIPTLTMFAHAARGEFNHSNNPTYLEYGQDDKLIPYTSSQVYREKENVEIANIVDSDYTEETPKFEKTTYISKIGIYDEQKNLIAIAKVSTPVKKREIDSYTFKLKMDM